MICNLSDNCQNPPTISYVWPWGEQGCACATHAPLLAQTERNTKRKVQIASLTPGAAPRLTRDERVAHHAKVLALEEELAESRARGAELHRAHEDVVRQLRTEKAKREAVEAEFAAAATRKDEIEHSLYEMRNDRDRTLEEVRRLESQAARTLPDVPG